MGDLTQIDRFPPPGPEIFYITHFEHDRSENSLKGLSWGQKDGYVMLFDLTASSQDDRISPVHYVHVDGAETRYFRLQLVSSVVFKISLIVLQ